jgi:archaellum component FlaC
MSMNVEAEIRDLKRRVSELEGSFGFLTQQVQTVHKDLLAFQEKTEQRFDRVDGRLDKIDGRLDKVDDRFDKADRRFDHLDGALRDIRTDMPKIVGEALRDYEIKQKKKP